MSGDHNMNQSDSGWRKRQIALDEKAENARKLGLDYEPDKTIMQMAREAGGMVNVLLHGRHDNTVFTTGELEAFEALVRADERNRTWTPSEWTEYERSIAAQEREACAKVVDAIEARCVAKDVDDPPLAHVSAAIRARRTTPPAAQPEQERNFCPRCGKRAGDYIHTCTPPQEKRSKNT